MLILVGPRRPGLPAGQTRRSGRGKGKAKGCKAQAHLGRVCEMAQGALYALCGMSLMGAVHGRPDFSSACASLENVRSTLGSGRCSVYPAL